MSEPGPTPEELDENLRRMLVPLHTVLDVPALLCVLRMMEFFPDPEDAHGYLREVVQCQDFETQRAYLLAQAETPNGALRAVAMLALASGLFTQIVDELGARANAPEEPLS